MTDRSPEMPGNEALAELVAETLDDAKAEQIVSLDVTHLTSITNTLLIASGRSDRHVKAIASQVVERCKAAGFQPLGVEGQESGRWVLADLGDVVVHIMQPSVRDYYQIEKLWDFSARDEIAR